MPRGRAPTHTIIIQPKDKNSKVRTKAGVAWMDADKGWLSLSINPGVVLDSRLQEDHYISIYKIRPRGDDEPPMPDEPYEGDDDDIPF